MRSLAMFVVVVVIVCAGNLMRGSPAAQIDLAMAVSGDSAVVQPIEIEGVPTVLAVSNRTAADCNGGICPIFEENKYEPDTAKASVQVYNDCDSCVRRPLCTAAGVVAKVAGGAAKAVRVVAKVPCKAVRGVARGAARAVRIPVRAVRIPVRAAGFIFRARPARRVLGRVFGRGCR